MVAPVIYKWQLSLPEKAKEARALGHLINGLFVAIVNNYAAIGFLVSETNFHAFIFIRKKSPILTLITLY